MLAPGLGSLRDQRPAGQLPLLPQVPGSGGRGQGLHLTTGLVHDGRTYDCCNIHMMHMIFHVRFPMIECYVQ